MRQIRSLSLARVVVWRQRIEQGHLRNPKPSQVFKIFRCANLENALINHSKGTERDVIFSEEIDPTFDVLPRAVAGDGDAAFVVNLRRSIDTNSDAEPVILQEL